MIAALLLALALAPSVHHPVSTTVAAAQAAFDRGLLLYDVYNGDAAYDAFARALAADPHLAMAAWGEALASGPDLNTPIDAKRFARAQAAVRQAVSLESFASAPERAYIDAMALRFAGDAGSYAANDARYIAAMQSLSSANPADNDAALLYAEALMEQHLNDAQARSLIEGVLMRAPDHPFANHLCIHSYDYADDHSPALACANRIASWTLSPPEAHLAHMPAHTYITLGRYAQALEICERAWALRQASDLPLKYEAHDAYTGYSVAMMRGDVQAALLWAQRTGNAYGGSDAWATFARFGMWSKITGESPPGEFFAVLSAGLAALHRGDSGSARSLLARYGSTDADYRWILEGAVDDAEGHVGGAQSAFARAIALQAAQFTGEELPLFPAGEFLGALYLHHGQFADAVQAYMDTLARYPDDPRALYGLSIAQSKLGQTAQAARTRAAFSAAWGGGSAPDLGIGGSSP